MTMCLVVIFIYKCKATLTSKHIYLKLEDNKKYKPNKLVKSLLDLIIILLWHLLWKYKGKIRRDTGFLRFKDFKKINLLFNIGIH